MCLFKYRSLICVVVLLTYVLAAQTYSQNQSEKKSILAETTQEKRVREFVAAFNARNIDAMLDAVDENVQWLSVDGAKIAVEAEGKKALRQSMESYFRGCPSCKSNLEWIQTAGIRVTALERASWSGKSGPKSQKSLSVYEFRDGKIVRVYYFPADVDVPPGAPKI